MKIAWKIKGFQRDETHRKCTQNHSGDQDRGKLEISLWAFPTRGFESHPLRQWESSRLLAAGFFILRRGIRFKQRVVRLDDSIPAAAKVVCFRQADSFHHRLCRGQLGSVVQVGVDVSRGREIAVLQPFLNLLERNTVGQKQRRTGVTEIVEAHPGQTISHQLRCSSPCD